jgi:hypothetical protein
MCQVALESCLLALSADKTVLREGFKGECMVLSNSGGHEGSLDQSTTDAEFDA